MKRSVNLSRTRRPRNPYADMIAMLRQLGYTDEQIKAALLEQQKKANAK